MLVLSTELVECTIRILSLAGWRSRGVEVWSIVGGIVLAEIARVGSCTLRLLLLLLCSGGEMLLLLLRFELSGELL